MFRDKFKTALKDLVEEKGPDGAARVLESLLEKGKLSYNEFSLKEAWHACEGERSVEEALTSSAFPKLTGTLINSRINSAYDEVPKIGDKLVTTIPSNVEEETFAGLTDAESPDEVGEGQRYPSSSIGEKFTTVRNKKYGRMIDITEETIYFDKTGQILDRARRIGIAAAQYKEKLIVEGVQDINTNVYRPSGIAQALYSAGNGNLITSNVFGESGMEEVMKKAQLMQNDAQNQHRANENFIFIDTNNLIVLVPVDKMVPAWQLANSGKTPESGENADNFFKGMFMPLSSPFITSQSATTWYAGNFKEDFVWTEVWPLQTLTQASGHDDSFTKEIKSRHKTRFYGNVGAVDHRHSFKSTE